MMFSEVLKPHHFHRMKKLLRSSKGSIIPESAMVIPLIILIVAASLSMMMEFYELVLSETQEDNRIFKAGFDEGKNIRRAAVIGDLFYEE